MKTFFFVSLALICSAIGQSSIGSFTERDGSDIIFEFIPRDSGAAPFRELDGRFYDLRPLFAWQHLPYRKRSASNRPLQNWETFTAKVYRILWDGCLIHNGDNYFFLTNYPNFKTLAEQESLTFTASKTGIHIHSDPGGVDRSLGQYDYGTVFSPAQKAAEARAKRKAVATK
jgi:hypothetical protein